jgi:hypothetical protein
MARQRPTSVLVMGILNMVFGALGLLFSLCAGGIIGWLRYGHMPTPSNQDALDVYRSVIEKEAPDYFQMIWISLGASIGLLALLFIAGIGLIAMRRWGRVLSIVFAIAFILLQSGGLVWNIKVGPAAQHAQVEMNKAFSPQQGQAMSEDPGLGIGTGVVFYVLEIVYCLVLLVMMFLPSVRAAFANTSQNFRKTEDYSDLHPGEND